MAGAEATLAASLFNGMKFYLTYTLSRRRRSKLSQLIFKNGGVVSQSPAGATQLVDSEVLDSRHPEWVAASFVEDSVASGELQDINQYTGTVFSTPRKQTRGRQSYTTEDDARMLYFIKSIMNWKPMQAVPPSVWKIAERQKVTSHSSQSMFERFQNHLQRKTPMEQRDIMNKALLEFNVQPRNSEMEHDSDDVSAAKAPPKQHSLPSSSSSGPRHATSSRPLEVRTKEMEEEKFSVTIAEPKSSESSSRINAYDPLQFSDADQRVQQATSCPSTSSTDTTSRAKVDNLKPVSRNGVQSSPILATTPPIPPTPPLSTSPAAPEMPTTSTVSVSIATSSIPLTSVGVPPKTTQPTPWNQQKKKRTKYRNDADSDGYCQSLLRTEAGCSDSDIEGDESKTHEDHGVFFRSVWAELLGYHQKRQRLQPFFGIAPAGVPRMSVECEAESEENPLERSRVMATTPTTDQETDKLICQLQLETNQDVPSVVHALYYCSGNPLMAKAFLTGSSPTGMWSPEEDLLLMNLVVEESLDRSTVSKAVIRGDFASMLRPRDTDAILERVLFLR